MHKLAFTCKILYDIDILDKNNEIIKIKEQLNLIKGVPKIKYNDKEWTKLHENFYNNTKKYFLALESLIFVYRKALK